VPEVENALVELAHLTSLIRQYGERIEEMAERRRELVRDLRDQEPPLTYRAMADRMGVSEQAVFRMGA
jgi:hypothetical protein